MRRKNKPIKPFSVPSWYARLDPLERAIKTAEIREKIHTLRHYTEKFDADRGYNLSDVRLLTASQLSSVDRHYADLRARLKSPHKTIIARNREFVRAIQQHSPQKMPGQFRYIIPVTNEETSTVRKARGNALEISTRLPSGAVLVDRFFYLPRKKFSRLEIGGKRVRARTFDDVISELLAMLPAMPQGRYGILMSQHGLVADTAGDKQSLIGLIRSWKGQYKGVTGKEMTPNSIVGFQYLGDTIERADATMTARAKAKRQLQANISTDRRNARRRLLAKARKGFKK